MGVTNFQNANLRLLVTDTSGILTAASLQQTGAAFGTGLVQVATVIITDAQIKSLPTTSVQMIASPPSGQITIILAALARLSWHGDYSNINANASLNLVYGTSENAAGQLAESNSDVSGLFALGGNCTAIFGSFGIRAATNFAINLGFALGGDDLVSTPILLNFDNGVSGNLTGGNSLNTLKITVYYIPTVL